MLELRDIYKQYEDKPLLCGVSFQMQPAEIVCLLGPSGSGKSTILRIIAGLEIPESGAVFWNGSDLAPVPVHQREFGLMFQNYALFPHRNVAENVAFGLRMQQVPAEEQQQRVTEALELVHMQDFAARRVDDLSGGEQQRVALARALAPRPRLLMLDEPLGALDHQLRERLLVEVRQILRQAAIPAIYVTHDHEEAFAIADRLILLRDGRVEQIGSPTEIFRQPRSAWVASFFGMGTLLDAEIAVDGQAISARTAAGTFALGQAAEGFQNGEHIQLLLRPEDARMAAGENSLTLRVTDQRFVGDRFLIWGEHASGLLLQWTSPEALTHDSSLPVSYAPEDLLPLRNGDQSGNSPCSIK